MGKKNKKGKKSKKSKSKKNIAKIKKRDPRTGRYTYYLGWRVKDTGKPGLDSLSEVEGICKEIERDYKAGRLTKREASGRYARLHNIIIPRVFKGRKEEEAEEIVERYWHRL